MKCPGCGRKIRKDQDHCEYCGARAEKRQVKVQPQILLPAGVGGLCVLAILISVFVLNPKNTAAGKLQEQLDLGNKYLEAADFERAEVAFHEALEIDEKSPDAAMGLAQAYNGQKRPDDALKLLKQANTNLKEIPLGSVSRDADAWDRKSREYQQVFDRTSDLFVQEGDSEKSRETLDEKDIVVGIFVENDVLPTLVPEEDTELPGSVSEEEDSELFGRENPDDQAEGESAAPEEEEGEDPAVPEEKEGEDPTVPEGEEGENPTVSEGEEGENPAVPEGEEGENPAVPEGEEGENPTVREGEERENPTVPDGEGGENPTASEEEEGENPTVREGEEGENPAASEGGDNFASEGENDEEHPDAAGEEPAPSVAPESGQEDDDSEWDYIYDPEYNGPEPPPEYDGPEPPPDYSGPEESPYESGAGGGSPEETPHEGTSNDGGPEEPPYESGTDDGGPEEPPYENGSDDGAQEEMPYDGGSEGQPESEEIGSAENEQMNTEAAETEAPQLTEDELLESYASDTILAQNSMASFSGSSVSYSSGSMSGLSGILGIQKGDINGDGADELLVIKMSNGMMSFDVYKVKDGQVAMTASGISAGKGFDGAADGVTYRGVQECFIKGSGVGIAVQYTGINLGDGNSSAWTGVTFYNIGSDGSASQAGSASSTNGTDMDSFVSQMSAMGMSGSWIHESGDVLTGMGLEETPMQDMGDVPVTLGDGLASRESGVSDLVIVSGSMPAGSGALSMSIKDYTGFGG